MDLNRIIQALKGTIDPKLRIAAENELNQVRSGPAAPPPAPRLSLRGAPISTPAGRRTRAAPACSAPTPGSSHAALPESLSEQLSHLLVTFASFHVVFLPQRSSFSRVGSPESSVSNLCYCFQGVISLRTPTWGRGWGNALTIAV